MSVSITSACRDISELNPVAQKACKLFMEECKKAGLGIFITETYRSQARQDYLYAQGRTRPGNKVTWTLKSNHTGRMAWDIAVNQPKSLYDTATLKKAGAIAKKLGITWGGDWTETPDQPHFEVKSNWQAPKDIETANVKGESNVEKKISFYTGGYSGESLLKVHNFLIQKGYYFKPTRNDGGSLSFEIGQFTEGTPKAKEMEQFLKSINAWYQIR
ncbi:MAG: M15 family metallopeptidase [Heyndrickxia oleronia]|jgi:peptidoglycan L-alanyl-D-glutamate endopeptidase CwlK|nr:M15 family metallopeptidase [Heyndrickxia oleronia]